MADLFSGLGGLGGLVKGLSSFMPQDDPEVKMMNASTKLSELKAQEAGILAEIGKQAISTYGEDAFGSSAIKLRAVRAEMSEAESALNAMKQEKEAKDQADRQKRDSLTCPNCGTVNAEGMRFCNECGSKLGPAAKSFCTSCGAENAPGTRFCGGCGARLA